MKTTLLVEKEFELKTIELRANVRYWEDITINEESDENGINVPFKNGDLWSPVIDIDTGIIANWPKGTTAEIHAKVCDQCSFEIKDEKGEVVISVEDEYVPRFLCPKENGYGDYIIMDIDENGQIQGWEVDEIELKDLAKIEEY